MGGMEREMCLEEGIYPVFGVPGSYGLFPLFYVHSPWKLPDCPGPSGISFGFCGHGGHCGDVCRPLFCSMGMKKGDVSLWSLWEIMRLPVRIPT